MGALDSRIALALMAKAQLVFGGEDRVLSFPLGGASYRSEELNFFPAPVTAESTRAALISLSSFSGFTNAIPQGQVWRSDAPLSLPNVYRTILEGAEIAELPEDPQDLADLHAAQEVLGTIGADGLRVDSPKYVAYKQLRDAYIQASQQYNAGRATGMTGDAQAAETWANLEPLMRATRDAALVDWETKGYRAEIDAAQATILELSRKTPVTTWGEWELQSRVGVGTVTDLTQAPFWPTYISPANACEVGWQHMSIGSTEVEKLQASAPDEMKQRIGSDAGTLAIEQLEFEYTTAKLHRPWFNGDLFSSRFWRPRPPNELLVSTGHQPFQGLCPLYASAIVFFRRIRATARGSGPEISAKLGAMLRDVDFGIFKVDREALVVKPPVGDPLPTTAHSAPMLKEALEQGQAIHFGAGPVSGRARLPGAEFANVLRAPADHVAPVIEVAPPEAKQKFALKEAVTRQVVLRDFSWQLPTPPAPSTPPGSSVIETDPEDIFILALICTVVPESPHPDPTLSW